MIEGSSGDRGRDSQERARNSARELIALLQSGVKLSPELSAQVMSLLSAQRSESRVEVEKGTVWGKFKNEFLRQEIALLSVEEREFIDKMSVAFSRDVTTFEAIKTKAVGSPNAKRDDYRSLVIRHASSDFTSEQLDQSFGKMPQPNLVKMLQKRPDHDVVTLLPYPGDNSRVVFRFDCVTPQNTSKMDTRICSHRYFMVAPANSNFTTGLKSGVHLRDIPFIIRNGLIACDPRTQGFVDAPMCGQNVLGEGLNPVTFLDCTAARILHSGDTQRDSPADLEQFSDWNTFSARASSVIDLNRGDLRQKDSPYIINCPSEMPRADLSDFKYQV